MPADKSDQPGVLGNLPRSRPGQRSEKRTGTTRASAASVSKPAAQPRPAAKRTAATAARKRKAATTARKPAAGNRKTAPRERPAPQPASSGSPDPITFAFRAAGKVAEVGLKTAGGLLRRLPGR